MKKKISTIILLTVFVINNFILISQANASFLKAGINALGKGAIIYNHQQKSKKNDKNY